MIFSNTSFTPPNQSSSVCSYANMLALLHRPGRLTVLSDDKGANEEKVIFSYPFTDDVPEKQRLPDTPDTFNQFSQAAATCLKKEPKISANTKPHDLWLTIQRLHHQISPKAILRQPGGWVVLPRFRAIANPFNPKNEDGVRKVFTLKEWNILKGIKEKILESMNKMGGSESVMLRALSVRDPSAFGEYLFGQLAKYIINPSSGIQNLFTLTQDEVDFFKKYYTLKPSISEAEIEGKLAEILKLFPGHPIRAAAHLSLLILDTHPFSDGNRRTSELMCIHVLRSAGIDRIPIHDDFKYREAIISSLKEQNYSIFERYLKKVLYPIQDFEKTCGGLYAWGCGRESKSKSCRKKLTQWSREQRSVAEKGKDFEGSHNTIKGTRGIRA